jgi:hypothetical protein
MRTLHLGSGTTMKQIIRLGNNRYIHLDTYGEYRETYD